MTRNGVDTTLIMPFPGAPDPIETHDRIAKMAQIDGGIRGIVNLSPHSGRAEYRHEASRCVRDLGFVALKVHTIGHAVDPGSARWTDGLRNGATARRACRGAHWAVSASHSPRHLM